MKSPQDAKVVAIIPARDEAKVIHQAVSSLLSQEFDGDLRVIVVDDNSADCTGEIARQLGITVITGAPLEPGWTGKLWALQQGVSAAKRLQPDFLLFTDADIYHHPQSLNQLVGISQARKLDLASHMVKLHCSTWQEKFTIPAFVFFFFMLYPPKWIQSASSRMAGAAGGCVLIRPEALAKSGGLSTIQGEVIDDCALARAVKRSGGRLWLGLSANTRSIRPYGSLNEIGRMISRSAFKQLNHSSVLLVGSILGLLLTYVIPVVALLSGNLLGLAAWLIMTLCFLPMVRFYGLNPLWALPLPLTACYYAGATIHSALSYWRGRGGIWKGRAQDLIH